MEKLFIEQIDLYQKEEYDTTQGSLFTFLYDIFQEKFSSIISNFEEWLNESKNQDNPIANVKYKNIILIIYL